MRHLIIAAHPAEDSLSMRVARAYAVELEQLQQRQWTVDFNRMGFNPALKKEELLTEVPGPRRGFRAHVLIAFLSSAILSAAQAAPQTADASRLYAPCAVCHQLNAWGSSDGTIPNLAGQRRHYLEKQLALFRSGARVDTAMQVVAIHPTISNQSSDIVVLATYLSRIDANPTPVVGAGDHLQVGLEVYAHICASCHGADGRGEQDNSVPRLAGQHYPYLRRQIESAGDLHKDLAPPEMSSALRGMPSSEKDALADYISRLGTSEAVIDSNSRPVPDKY